MPSDRKYAFFAFVTAAVCVLALYIHRHRQGQTGRIDNLLISAAGNMQRQVFFFSQGMRRISDHYVMLVGVQKRNEDLEREISGLKLQVSALREVDLENTRLRESLDFRHRSEQQLLSAHVVAHDVSSDYFGIRIDRGSSDGVKVGMGVISPAGLVGRVLRVAPRFADVRTLVDPNSKIDALVQRSRARGIVSGQAKQATCKMSYVDRLEDVAVGDAVVSSGYEAIFPKGILVGYAIAVVPSSTGILQNVMLRSAVDITRLEEVFVVLPPGEPEKTT